MRTPASIHNARVPRKPKDQNDELARAIGQQITHAMERLGITLTELHRRTGISRTVLLAYTRGTYAPGARELKLLCEHLAVTPNVLFFGTNEGPGAPFRLGDLTVKAGTQTAAVLMFWDKLTHTERKALLVLVDAIAAARDPAGHKELLDSLEKLADAADLETLAQIEGGTEPTT